MRFESRTGKYMNIYSGPNPSRKEVYAYFRMQKNTYAMELSLGETMEEKTASSKTSTAISNMLKTIVSIGIDETHYADEGYDELKTIEDIVEKDIGSGGFVNSLHYLIEISHDYLKRKVSLNDFVDNTDQILDGLYRKMYIEQLEYEKNS